VVTAKSFFYVSSRQPPKMTCCLLLRLIWLVVSTSQRKLVYRLLLLCFAKPGICLRRIRALRPTKLSLYCSRIRPRSRAKVPKQRLTCRLTEVLSEADQYKETAWRTRGVSYRQTLYTPIMWCEWVSQVAECRQSLVLARFPYKVLWKQQFNQFRPSWFSDIR